MNILKRSVTIFLVLICINVLRAQNVRVLALNDAIQLSYSYNSDLITANYEKSKALKIVSQTYNENLIPTLTFSS